MTPLTDGSDPRVGIRPESAAGIDDSGPVVGLAQTRRSGVLVVTIFAALAVGLFVVLNANRTQGEPASLVTPTAVTTASYSAPPPLQVAEPPPPQPPAPPPVPAPLFGLPPAAPATSNPPPPGSSDGLQRRRAPTVVVDLGEAAADPVATPSPGISQAANGSAGAGEAAGRIAADQTAGSGGSQIGADEQFAERIGDGRPARARAVALRNLDTLVPQGATILAVLETAINSDLPGYTRAVVARDVLSFDGKSVLIPRGSRVIGQYKSAVALGASRAFVIWTRIIRPDGVSIQIASPGADALGRGGLAGDVNRHFFQRFGGSILLSVLNAGIASVARNPSTTITIGSPGAAVGAASSAVQSDAISPTIRVPQGATVNIFVARDLDFSGVGPAR